MTTTESPNSSNRPQRPFWKWIVRLAIASLLLAAVLSATVFFSRDLIAAKSDEFLKAELTKRKIYADYGKSEFSVVRGLVFHDVKVFRTDTMSDPLFSISDIAFAFNPLRLIRGEGSPPRVTSRAGTLTIHHPERQETLTELELAATITPGAVRIDQLDGNLTGLRLSLSGDISTKSTKPAEPVKETESTAPGKGLADLDLSPLVKVLDLMAVDPQDSPPLLSAHVVRVDDGGIRTVGSFSGKNFSWRGAPFDSFEVDFATADDSSKPASASEASTSLVRIPSLKIGYKGKSLVASGSYAINSKTITLTNLRSAIDLPGLIAALRPESAGNLAAIRFAEPPVITMSGTFPAGNPAGGNLKGTIISPVAAIPVDGKKEILLTNLTGDFTMADGAIKSENLSAGIFGGHATAPSSFRPFEKPVRFTTELTLKDLSLQELSKFTGYDPNPGQAQPGTLFLSFSGGGTPSLAGTTGGGRLELTGASFINVPIFRKLVPSLKQVLTFDGGAGDVGTNGDASFRIDGGVLTSNDIHLKDAALAIDGTAWVDFPKQQLKATAAVRTRGVTTLITSLAGKALEIEASGSFDDFSWRFVNVPGLENVGSLIGADTGAGGAVIKGVNTAGQAAGGVLDAAGAVTGLKKDPEAEREKPLSGLKKLLQGKGSD